MSSPICLNRLIRETSPERHARATAALQDGSLTVTIKHRTEYTLRAIVRNGDGHEYGVHIGDFGAVCDCPDAAWRGASPCKHAVAVAMYAVQPPPEPVEEKTHLMFSNGALLCSEPQPLKVWRYPWPETIIAHQAQWPEVQLCQACVTTRHAQHPTSHPLKAAA